MHAPLTGKRATTAVRLSFDRLVAYSTNQLPLNLASFQMPGCTLYTSLDIMIGFSNTNGSVVWPVQMPSRFWFLGRQFYNQAIVDAPGVNPLGVVVSNAATGLTGAR